MVIPVIKSRHRARSQAEAGALMTELIVGLAILGIAVFPLAFSFAKEHQYLRNCYQRAVTIEIVDGEMEVLLAGDWRSFTNGVHALNPRGGSAANLPPGQLQLTVSGKSLRLEWLPEIPNHGGKVVREATMR